MRRAFLFGTLPIVPGAISARTVESQWRDIPLANDPTCCFIRWGWVTVLECLCMASRGENR